MRIRATRRLVPILGATLFTAASVWGAAAGTAVAVSDDLPQFKCTSLFRHPGDQGEFRVNGSSCTDGNQPLGWTGRAELTADDGKTRFRCNEVHAVREDEGGLEADPTTGDEAGDFSVRGTNCFV